ncbi:hypothetical protein [Mycobacterium deserti]|uniref:Uncharacterized protein n=1 Tax=Mycobacterium deserti TaxID=2978347 RepID=A0ABT2M7U3_9MYCO|nr:hypothetical protein [Mycobacterium deserti]MCT7657225.1 hypothetical protein [Mycobacterium deserti]
MIALDFRARDDEPSVIHVDQEVGYRITTLAPDFAAFVNGLRHAEDFDEEYVARDR